MTSSNRKQVRPCLPYQKDLPRSNNTITKEHKSFSPCPDIYSLGATMYNLLTGKIPTESILRATRPLQNPSELNRNISPKTEAAIIKAMQIIPADSFPNGG